MGVKAYDFFAGDDGVLEPSYWITYHEARKQFPMLKQQGLKGGVVYFDGQHNDSRMCLGIALTAAAKGAVLANHVEVTKLSVDPDTERVNGATVKDNLSGDSWTIRAKQVVNATGPFTDAIRQMADANAQNMISPSSGVHVVLSNQYSPEGMGLIIPETSDGRVIFLLPWEGSTVIGTTDSPTPITSLPKPYEHEIQFILKETSAFLNHDIKREDVDAAWSGIRPLAKDVHAKDTASTSRDHVIEYTKPGMITIAGGKWTTYRKMAEDTVDAVLSENKKLIDQARTKPALKKFIIDTRNVGKSQTLGVPLIGAAGWSLQLPTTLHRLGFDHDIASHLSHNYGDKSFDISRIIQREKNLNKRLAAGYPFIEAEIVFAARHEYAFTATDMISNRIRLAFLNSDASYHALPRVIHLMARELGWDTSRKILEYQLASRFLATMNRKGRNPLAHSDPLKLQYTEARLREVFDAVPIREEDIKSLRKEFDQMDKAGNGVLSRSEVMQLITNSSLFGLQDAKLAGRAEGALRSAGEEGLNKPTKRFLEQLDLLDKDDRISFEPFLFSVAASFMSPIQQSRQTTLRLQEAEPAEPKEESKEEATTETTTPPRE
jgi:glycerol-3-phosphate dehydrogenase